MDHCIRMMAAAALSGATAQRGLNSRRLEAAGFQPTPASLPTPGGIRGLEHTPPLEALEGRWKGGWKGVGRRHGAAPASSRDRCRDGGPYFST